MESAKGQPFLSGTSTKGVLHVVCIRCCTVETNEDDGRPRKSMYSVDVEESIAFQRELEPFLQWKHNGQQEKGTFSTIPQHVRRPAICRLLRQSTTVVPDYFVETHCGQSKCGAMFSVWYAGKRISRIWTRDGMSGVHLQMINWWHYHRRELQCDFDVFMEQCQVLCEETHLPFDFSQRNRKKLQHAIDGIGCDSYIYVTANRIALIRGGKRVVVLNGTGPDFPWSTHQ